MRFLLEVTMPEIILKTDNLDKATRILQEAIETEVSRLRYSLDLSKKRLLNFEKKYPNTPLTVVIYANDRAIIQSAFMINWINLVNTTLTISGVIETYNDKPEIVLKKADQIVSID